jgi:tRNA (uracil-5-)-methyltransferase
VGDFLFENPAGAFFQNNNSILPSFIAYIREHILPQDNSHREKKITHLIDAYCGSGLFTITLSSLFKRSVGIDISPSSIDFAKRNAKLNNLPESQATFLSADASNIFSSVEDLPADETVVVIDPPRKGCDEQFLRLLLHYGPARIVYVSCNVHTQARDVGMLVRGKVDSDNGMPKKGYEIESLRGFDFFPQTGHVEGVAVLRRKTSGEVDTEAAQSEK